MDVGIAYGIYDVVLKRELNFEVYGIDHPDNISVYCRHLIHRGIPVLPCDLHFDSIPFPEKMFDTVIASEIVEHLLISPKAFFKKNWSVLKTGGRLIVTTPNFSNLRNIFYLIKGINPAATFPDKATWLDGVARDIRVHPREYTVREIRSALLDSGFNIGKIKTVNTKLKTNSSIQSKLLKFMMMLTPKNRGQIVAIGIKK